MKKSLFIQIANVFLLIALVVSVSSCAGKTPSDTGSGQSTIESTDSLSENSQSDLQSEESPSGSEDISSAASQAASQVTSTVSTPKSDGKIDLGATSYNFKGEEITVASIWPKSWGFEKAAASDSAALWKQWRDLVEKTYKCKLKMIPLKGNDTKTQLITKIAAGDKIADLLDVQRLDMEKMRLAKGMLQDLTKVKGLNLKDPRWSAGAIEAATFGSAVYGVAGYQNNFQTGFIVNLDLLAKLKGVEDPFKQVEEMKWTYNAFYNLAKAATADLNGNKIMEDTDQYGVELNPTAWAGLLHSRGVDLISYDAKGKASYSLNTTANKAVIAEIKEKLITTGYCPAWKNGQPIGANLFKQGKVLLYGAPLHLAQEITATTKIKLGWLPIPTADGKTYKDTMDGWTQIFCIAATNKDTTKAVALLNAYLAVAESNNELYIEDSWNKWFSTHPQTKTILKKVFKNKVFMRYIPEVVYLAGYRALNNALFLGHDLETQMAAEDALARNQVNDTYNS